MNAVGHHAQATASTSGSSNRPTRTGPSAYQDLHFLTAFLSGSRLASLTGGTCGAVRGGGFRLRWVSAEAMRNLRYSGHRRPGETHRQEVPARKLSAVKDQRARTPIVADACDDVGRNIHSGANQAWQIPEGRSETSVVSGRHASERWGMTKRLACDTLEVWRLWT